MNDLQSPDGTRIRAWSNGGDGVPVVISNGLGVPPSAWPWLADADCGFAAVSWWHRGLDGPARLEGPRRVRVEDHTADLEAVMDAAGVDRALLLGWSVGVNVAFEFARAHPERVAGILGVGGVPGGSFRAFGPPGLPAVVREAAGRSAAWMLRLVGPPAVVLARGALHSARAFGADHLPVTPHLTAASEAARELAGHSWTAFSEALLVAGEHPAMDTRDMDFPVTLVAGTADVAAAAPDVAAAAAAMPDARFVPLLGTHFLPFEQPGRLRDELVALAERAGPRW